MRIQSKQKLVNKLLGSDGVLPSVRDATLYIDRSTTVKVAPEKDWLKSIVKRDHSNISKHYTDKKHLQAVEKTAMGENSGVAGGYIVPPDYNLILFTSLEEYSILIPRALVVPMMSLEIQLPKPRTKGNGSAGVSPFFGGFQFQWGTEAASTTDVSPTAPFDMMTIKACDLIGWLAASNQFVDDFGPAGEMAFIELLGRAAAWYAEYGFFNGYGAAKQQPVGIINAPGSVRVARTTGNQVKAADLATMAQSLIPLSWNNAIWVVSPTAFTYIVQLVDFQKNENPSVGDPGFAGFLFSRPLFVSEKLPAVGSLGDVVFIDPSMYVIGMRQEVVIQASRQSPEVFQKNQTAFRVWLRVDGQPLLDSTVTLADGSTTASAFVVLQ